jgi:hypothetical protein
MTPPRRRATRAMTTTVARHPEHPDLIAVTLSLNASILGWPFLTVSDSDDI